MNALERVVVCGRHGDTQHNGTQKVNQRNQNPVFGCFVHHLIFEKTALTP